IVAYLIHLGGGTMIAILLLFAILLLTRNYLKHKKRTRVIKAEDSLSKAESNSIHGVIEESSDNISKVLKRVNKINENTVGGLINQDLAVLKKAKDTVTKLETEIDDIQNNIFFFIKNLDESYVKASKLYIDVISDLQDIAQSCSFIAKASHKHVLNNHKALKRNQSKELIEVQTKLADIFTRIRTVFDERKFKSIPPFIEELRLLLGDVRKHIHAQVERTRTTESSPKNTTLYFSILLETKDLIKASINLLEIYAYEGKNPEE
ncbi:MAG: inorganic phosphate transporter, partial [Flavobacteriaceae bacterium]|nr:inorganic phosphate transporter [Flavobacteriaceae bacterium]